VPRHLGVIAAFGFDGAGEQLVEAAALGPVEAFGHHLSDEVVSRRPSPVPEPGEAGPG
jgi:hypothetical protein